MSVKNFAGRWHSDVSVDERVGLLAEELSTLSPDERETFEYLMAELAKEEDEEQEGHSLLKTINEIEYEREVVDIETWIKDPYYYGEVGRSLYPKLQADLIELFSSDYDELILTGSIGWGKCLNRDAEIHDAVTGRRWRVEDLAKRRASLMVQGSDKGRATKARAQVVLSGRKRVAVLHLASGKRLRASIDHPVLGKDGFRELWDFEEGDLVATPRKLLPPSEPLQISDEEVKFIAYMLSDGGTTQSAVFTNADKRVCEELEECAAVLDDYGRGQSWQFDEAMDSGGAQCNMLSMSGAAVNIGVRGVRPVLRKWGLLGKKSKNKKVPDKLFGLNDRQLALFVNRVWAW